MTEETKQTWYWTGGVVAVLAVVAAIAFAVS